MSYFKAKMHKIRFPASVRAFVRTFFRLLDGVLTLISLMEP